LISIGLFALFIADSFFQAWWNFHLKKIEVDKSAFLFVGWLVFGLVAVPLSFFFVDKPFHPDWWNFVLATGLIQGMYLVALSTAYTLADVSLIFPLARGLSIALTSITFILFVKQPVNALGATGIAMIFSGAMLLAFRHFSSQKTRVAMLLALVIGVLVSSYSVLDSFGAQKIPLVFYIAIMNIVAPLFALPWLYKSKKQDFIKVFKNHLLLAFLVALAGSAAYLIVVWAYTLAPAAYVLALREVSIVITALLGVVYLKEPMTRLKAAGITLILLGILLIKLA
ncbi:DMT family transporter, partial [bacterium]|nr:DMT family transporter [bacterium]